MGVFGAVFEAVVADVRRRRLAAALEDHQGRRNVTLDRVGDRCDDGVRNRGVAKQQVLDFLGVNVFPAAGKHVVDARLEVVKARGITTQDIAGAQPAVNELFARDFGALVIAKAVVG